MKKASVIILAAIISSFLFTGCGQDLNLTVYNSTGVSAATGWVAINVASENNNNWFFPTTYALDESQCTSSNSTTLKLKENTTVTISGNGINFGEGDGADTSFTLPTGEVTLYGGLTGVPAWYASVNMNTVVFYKK